MKKCGQPCEIWSRVVGYFRPVKSWNRGKKQEFEDRKNFVLGHETKKQRNVENERTTKE